MLQLLFVDIEKFPVTNAEYWEFCEATSRDKGRTAKGQVSAVLTTSAMAIIVHNRGIRHNHSD